MCHLKYKQFFTSIVLIGTFLLGWTYPLHAKDLISVDKALQKIFKDADMFEPETIALSAEQIKVIEEKAKIIFGESHSTKVILYTAKVNDQVLGYVLEDIVIGKWGPIHYLVGLDTQGTILKAIVLDYKEIRGRPVAKKRFLRQYKKKNISDPVKLRRDIDGVTGATISSRSMTNGIRKLLYIFDEVKKEQ